MLITEGTFPYNGGGVSTWAQTLCNEVTNAEFTLYAINANFEHKPKYDLSDNVKQIIQVPLWTPDEPYDYMSYGDAYYKTIGRKEWTSKSTITKEFIPVFSELLHFIYGEQQHIKDLDETFHKLWLYFEDYDYKETMRSEPVWETYCNIVSSYIISENNPTASLLDLTIGMRWIYRFLIPLAITDVPECDISHVTISGFPIIPALIASYKYGTPIILTEHGVFIRERLLAINSSEYPFFLKNLLIRFSEAIARLSYYKSDRIISVNEFNKKWEILYGAEAGKIQVVYNGVDHELFKPLEKPEHLKSIPTVVALARVFELKDVITMIKTCKVVSNEIPEVQFLVYGDDKAVPEYTEDCLALVKQLQIEANFKFMGPKPNPHTLFCEGDISILTSISEGFPYTVIESMSCGIPVVATDVGGVKEGLDETSGFLCKPKDAEAIGKSVIVLLNDKALRKQMSLNARKRVMDHFTMDKFILAYENAYKDIQPLKSNKKNLDLLTPINA